MHRVHQILPLKGPKLLSFSGTKTRSAVREFYILLAEPHKTYRSGDKVAGQVILVLDKNISDIVIKLALVGYIKVHATTPLRSDKKEALLNHSIVLYGDTGSNELALTKGEHRFPFIVKLPKKNIYTSISFEKGEIKYLLKCHLCDRDSPHAKFESSEMLLNIVKPINLSLLPKAQPKTLSFRSGASGSGRKTLRHIASATSSSANSCDSLDSQGSDGNANDIQIRVEIPSVGYLKGETIPVKLAIRHCKPVANTSGIFVTLIRICELDMGEDYELQSFRKDLAQSILPLVVDPQNGVYEVATSVKVPLDSFPTIVTNLVSFQYYVEVLFDLSKSSKLPSSQQPELVDDEIIHLGAKDTIYNVDRLKQMKNVLTVTSEIVIGTERKPLKTPSSIVTPASLLTPPSAPSMSSSSSSDIAVPYEMPSPPPTSNPASAEEEKEMLRLREQALLPSEPPMASPTLSPTTISRESTSPSRYTTLPPYSEVDSGRFRPQDQAATASLHSMDTITSDRLQNR